MTETFTVETLSDQVARNIQHVRKSRHLSTRDLAERCARLGAPELSAPVLMNLEAGRRGPDGRRRRRINVDELLVLARALDVPPILLFFALGSSERSNVTPGERRETWAAIQWFVGHRPYSDQPSQREEIAYNQASAPLALYELYGAHVTAWQKAQKAQRVAKTWGKMHGDERRAAEILEEALESARQAQEDIHDVRRQMMRHGFPPPDLPPGIGEPGSDPVERMMMTDETDQ